MNQLRCAVIGCGRIGCGYDDYSDSKTIRTHAGAYFQNPNTSLVALCDVDEFKLKKYGEKYKVKGLYTKSYEMFEIENIECVSICTSLDSHLELVKQSAKYGVKAIFLEKPISNNLLNAKKIIKICKNHRIRLIINHHRRFDSAYSLIKKDLTDKKFGIIQLVNIYYGRGIANAGSHLFDILRLLFGEVKSLKANFSKNKSAFALDSNIDVELEFSNKLICRMQALDATNYGLFEMDVLGTKGRIKINFVTNSVEYFTLDQKNFLDSRNLIRSKIKPPKPTHSAIPLGIKNIILSLSSKKPILCTGNDGYKSLELIVASLQSTKKNKRVDLPLQANKYKIFSK